MPSLQQLLLSRAVNTRKWLMRTFLQKCLKRMTVYINQCQVSDTGLYINPDVPHLGAPPDGLVTCDCCGEGCLEIKCPLCRKDQFLGDCTDPKFYLQKRRGWNFIVQP